MPPQVHAGRLKFFLNEWSSITNDNFILEAVSGYKIPFIKIPNQRPENYPRRKYSEIEIAAIQTEISHLLSIQAIGRCNSIAGQFISDIFLIPKADGSSRFILNLKKLNKYVQTEHFKMEDIRTATKLVTQGSHMINIDIKEAYFLIPIHEDFTKYLRFYFQGILYEFKALAFGLCSAPFIFTKILKPVISHLRSQGLISVRYLDDILCIAQSANDCLKNARKTINCLSRLGFIINDKKTILIPKTSCKFLGFIIDTETMTLQLPDSKRQKILKATISISRLKRIQIRAFAQYLGSLTAACPAIPYGWLYTKSLERVKYLALLKNNENYEAFMEIPVTLHDDLFWWKNNISVAVNPIRQHRYDCEVFTDASTTGWGVSCGSERVGGHWSTTERLNHINYLELMAVYFGLKTVAGDKRDCDILLRVDNTTAISYVNRMGGVQYPHLNQVANMIWKWCEKRRIFVFASYIPSAENIEADAESRKLNIDTEWELGSNEFKRIIKRFHKPNIDLFASRINAKCSLYVSWKKDPFAYSIDAFTINWSQFYFYAFPPFALILKTLNKIMSDQATGIVVVPFWTSQPWYPLYRSLCIEEMLILPPSKYLLISPFRSIHPLHRQLSLAVCVLSGRPSADNLFRNRH